MDIQFIDITTFRGVSSEAEHFYAKVGNPEDLQEFLITSPMERPNMGVYFINEHHMRYMPTYDEAKALYLKDHWEKRHKELDAFDEDQILEMVEDGVGRFPSVLSVVETAKKMFPESILCFSISGSQKEFAKWMQRNEDSEQVHKIIKLILKGE